MAEFLVKAIDATNADSTISARDCFKLGDIVVVMEDGHPWGVEEDPATANPRLFFLIKVAGMDVTAARAYLAPERSLTDFDPATGLGVRVARRNFQLQWADIPAGAQATLLATGTLSIGWNAVKTYVLDKTTQVVGLP